MSTPHRSWRSSFLCRSLARLAVEPFLRGRKAGKTGHCGAEIDRLPFRIESGDVQRVDAAEQVVGETRDSLVAVGADGPIVRDKSGRHRDGGDPLTGLYQGGVLPGLELSRQVIILEPSIIGHWQE